ncbi:MAG: hypothetical protein LBP59_15500 [Planctomycetaceae bacterium]|nr:hypothetical protein [Planctomycetaceae bacterium]
MANSNKIKIKGISKNSFVQIGGTKNKRGDETPPTFLQKNEFLETPSRLKLKD